MDTIKRLEECPVKVTADEVTLEGSLCIPEGAGGIAVFAHGSGSSRFSPRNRYVAQVLRESKLATLLIDLLTEDEERVDLQTGELRFDIGLLAARVVSATRWVKHYEHTQGLKIGYFGASTGAAAALVAAAGLPDDIAAIVSRGGRPDLAGNALYRVKAPTLLIVGGRDYPVVGINREAFARLQGEKKLVVLPGATHLFEEPGALEDVARLAASWFTEHLKK